MSNSQARVAQRHRIANAIAMAIAAGLTPPDFFERVGPFSSCALLL
jgi:hypothetical protein